MKVGVNKDEIKTPSESAWTNIFRAINLYKTPTFHYSSVVTACSRPLVICNALAKIKEFFKPRYSIFKEAIQNNEQLFKFSCSCQSESC